jgi:hypothetical protein
MVREGRIYQKGTSWRRDCGLVRTARWYIAQHTESGRIMVVQEGPHHFWTDWPIRWPDGRIAYDWPGENPGIRSGGRLVLYDGRRLAGTTIRRDETMPDARDVCGGEAQEVRALFDSYSPDTMLTVQRTVGTGIFVVRFAHVPAGEAQTRGLVTGWYQVGYGIVLHWTNKNDVLREIGQLLRTD